MGEYNNFLEMPIKNQFANIGLEVGRAIDRRKKHENEAANAYIRTALSLLAYVKLRDDTNVSRRKEIELAQDELIDYFWGENAHNNDDASIMRFYDDFIYSL